MKHQWITRDAKRGSECKVCGTEQTGQNTENRCKGTERECANCGHMAFSHNAHGCKATCNCKEFVTKPDRQQ